MKLIPTLIAAAAAIAATGVSAQVAGSIGGMNDSASFLALSSSNVSGGADLPRHADLPRPPPRGRGTRRRRS